MVLTKRLALLVSNASDAMKLAAEQIRNAIAGG